MSKIFEKCIGEVVGIGGYMYANHPDDGRYQIGTTSLEEFIGIVGFDAMATMSGETVSTIGLQLISGWHLACLCDKLFCGKNNK
jgi:hypothetical protein